MSEQTVAHSSFVIERVYPTTPARVFAAFSDPVKKQRWFVEGDGFEMESFDMDFRVGGKEITRFRSSHDSPVKGASLENQTVYQDIVPGSRIVLAYTMAVAERRISASLATFEILPTEAGTKLIFTEQAAFFENSDGPEIRKFGWTQLLEKLAKELAS